MKHLKYLKKFENFYLNDNDIPEEDDRNIEDGILDGDMEEMDEVSPDDDDCDSCDHDIDDTDDTDDTARRRVWGDEVIEERKRSPKKEKKEEEEDAPKSKGLSAKQKKLPKALQAAILKRMKK